MDDEIWTCAEDFCHPERKDQFTDGLLQFDIGKVKFQWRKDPGICRDTLCQKNIWTEIKAKIIREYKKNESYGVLK